MAGSYERRRSSSGRGWIPVGLAVGVVAAASLVAVGPISQTSAPAGAAERVMPRDANDGTLGYWTPMGIRVRTGDDSFQDPGLNQAVYALAKYDGDIYAGGLFDDTGGGGNNEANCSDDAEYPLQCIAKWNPATNAWTSVGAGLNEQVDSFLVVDDTLYVGGEFDDTVGGPGLGSCNPAAGLVWTPQEAAADDSWSAVTWGDDTFVAVASAGVGQVMTSPDGVNWADQTAADDDSWSSVIWGGPAGQEKFVAVASEGDDSRVMYSTDGATWTTPLTSIPLNDWQSVAWGDDTFVAVAASSDDSQVMTSTDGISWTPQEAASDDSWSSVTWGGPFGAERFVAVASNGDDTRVMTSTDGANWSSPSKPVPVSSWESVAWGNRTFVAVASTGDDTQVMTSDDGLTWASRAGSVYDDSWASVTWGGDTFVAVASSGVGQQVMYARDGIAWSTRTSGTVPNQWQSVAWSDAGTGAAVDDTIVAVASGADDSQVMTSVATPSPGELRCIAAWNGSDLTWTALGGGVNGGVVALSPLGDDTLIVAGGFGQAGSIGFTDSDELPGLAAWFDDTWIAPGMGGFNKLITSLLAGRDDTTYIGGEYNADADDSGITLLGGPFVDPYPSSWFPMSTGFSWINPEGDPPETPGRVDALALIDDTVYAGGYFSWTGDQSRPLANLASWNGTSWNTVGDGLNTDDSQSFGSTSVRALASDDTRGLLYVGGTFDNVAGGAGNGLCDDTDIAVGPLRCVTVWDAGINEFIPFKWGSDDDSNGLTGEVKAFVVDDSVVYVGGQFNTWPEGGFPKAWNLKNVGKWTWNPPSDMQLGNLSGRPGSYVDVTGWGLVGVSSVRFGSTEALFDRDDSTSLTAEVPNLRPGNYVVYVNAVGGEVPAGSFQVTGGPSPQIPPSAPRSVSAVAGDASATVSWLPPASSGSSMVTSYTATASPGGQTCSTSPPSTSCTVMGLTNGTTYTFTVTASSAAGTSVASAPSNAVTPKGPEPPPTATLVIVGTRSGQGVQVTGSTTGFGMGGMVTAHTRVRRGVPYTTGATTLVDNTGGFSWSRKVAPRKTLWVYFTGGGAKSNILRMAP